MKESDFRKLALSLAGVSEHPHFDRAAFRTVRRIFTTLSSDGKDANVRIEPDAQDALVASNPDAFAALAGAWGASGWTKVTLANTTVAEVRRVLIDAHALALPASKKKRR